MALELAMRPTCEACGLPISRLDRLWVDGGDGVVRASSGVSLGRPQRPLQLWHHPCLPQERHPLHR
jgi:hypothetical protein